MQVLAAVSLLSFAQTVEFPATPLRIAIEAARTERRLILAEFWTFNVEPSRSYAERVLSQRPLLDWLAQNAVGARVNADFNRKLRDRFAVKDLPTLILFDSDLRIWCRIAGPKKAEEILKALEEALADRLAFSKAREILEADPREPRALSSLVKGYLRQEDAAEAESALVRLREADPAGSAACHEGFAFDIASGILEPRGNVKEAIRVFALAADWARKGKKEVREKALFHLASLKLLGGEPEAAAEVLELLLGESERFPDRSKALYTLGWIYVHDLKETKLEKGKQVLRRLMEGYADRFSVEAEKLLEALDADEGSAK